MKKLLSVLLAVVMLLGSFSMVSFAADSAPAEDAETSVISVIGGAIKSLVEFIKSQKNDDGFGVTDIRDIVVAIANGDTDFDGNGETNVYDLLTAIETRINEDATANGDEETLAIATIVFTVIRIVFGLIEDFFGA